MIDQKADSPAERAKARVDEDFRKFLEVDKPLAVESAEFVAPHVVPAWWDHLARLNADGYHELARAKLLDPTPEQAPRGPWSRSISGDGDGRR